MTAYITVKGNSIRCPKKNHTLLPYVLKHSKDLFDNIVVISDDIDLINTAKEYKVQTYYQQDAKNISEFHAIYDYLSYSNKLNLKEDFVILPVTQPFRTVTTIQKVINANITNYDVITTYTEVSNRSIFMLNDDYTFKIESYNRKGSMCNTEKMIDGSIYRMTNSFLKTIIESNNTNHLFWHSKIKFILNDNPIFLDVDTPKDLMLFIRLSKYI